VPAIHDLQLSQFPLDKFTPLTSRIKVCDIDFSGKLRIPENEAFTEEFQTLASGEANAVFFWWDIRMDPEGTIVLSCAPHWNHPDTETLAKSKDEVTRRNSIPWRDHWMQGCFYLKSRFNFDENSRGFVKSTHDEFSWWFENQRLKLNGRCAPACSTS
jgi:type III protein arginine methyltransferase